MKQVYTQSRKARRHSAFHKLGGHGSSSEFRRERRIKLQPKDLFRKTWGKQIVRTQRIFLKKDRFGAPIYKTIQHAAV